MNARNRVPLIGPHTYPTGSVTELELLSAMLARGADVMDRPPLPLPDRDPGFGQIPTKPVDTALIRAARSADVEAMRLLVEAGADPKLPESDGLTTVIAVTSGPEIPPLVIVDRERPAEPDALAAAEFLLAHGVDVDAADRFGVTALHTVAKRGYVDVLRYPGRPRREPERRGSRPGARRSTTRSAARPRCSVRRPRAPRQRPRCASSARARVLRPRRAAAATAAR